MCKVTALTTGAWLMVNEKRNIVPQFNALVRDSDHQVSLPSRMTGTQLFADAVMALVRLR